MVFCLCICHLKLKSADALNFFSKSDFESTLKRKFIFWFFYSDHLILHLQPPGVSQCWELPPCWVAQSRPCLYWLHDWHILKSNDKSSFTSNTLLIKIQYCYQFKYFTDLIQVMRRMVKWNMKKISNTKWNVWIIR